jgi:hypothetical protein
MPLTKAKSDILDLDKDVILNTIHIGRGLNNRTGNTVLGTTALDSNTTGNHNIAIGLNANTANTTGIYNVAIGTDANAANIASEGNIAIGYNALKANVQNRNIAIGLEAMLNNINGSNNVAVGESALRLQTAGEGSTAIGTDALYNSTGQYNTALGASALQVNTTGIQNTGVGVSALNSVAAFNNATGLGANTAVTGSNQVQLGDSATTTYAYGAVQNRSDIRDKTDVRDTELGLDFLNSLRPVDFKWDMREDYKPKQPQKLPSDATQEEKDAYAIALAKWLEDVKLSNITHDGSKKRNRFHHGLIAQEVKAVLDAKGLDFGGFQDHKIANGDDVLSIGYIELIAPMIKAIQELSAEVASLKAQLNP